MTETLKADPTATPSQRLQRVLVCMHYDPTLATAIFRGETDAGLAPDQLQMLRRVDPRAFRCDPERGLRTLQALVEEAPASSALAGITHIQGFFASHEFHTSILQRRSLIARYCGWLEDKAGPIAQLEAAIAAARRRVGSVPESAGDETQWQTAPGVASVRLPAQTLERYGKLRAFLGHDPVAVLASNQPLPPLPKPHKKRLQYLLIADDGLAPGREGLHRLLTAADQGIAHTALLAIAREAGASDTEAESVLQTAADEGLIVRRVSETIG